MADAEKAHADHIVKLLLIGDSSVGKSCLLLRYYDNSFTNNFITTIGIDFKVRTVTLLNKKGEEKTLRLQIWDTAGQERFKTITTAYYRGAQGIFLIYDVTSPSSFENVTSWLTQITRHASSACKRVLVANKCDNPPDAWKISHEQGVAMAKNHNLPYFETSAKTGAQVNETFDKMAEMVLEEFEAAEQKFIDSNESGTSVKFDGSPATTKKGCC